MCCFCVADATSFFRGDTILVIFCRSAEVAGVRIDGNLIRQLNNFKTISAPPIDIRSVSRRYRLEHTSV